MLVSAAANDQLRREVAIGLRPTPEYLVLEQRHGVTLIDWSSLGNGGRQRTRSGSLKHLIAAWPRLSTAEAVLSDGEHLGIPLALAMRPRPRRPAHVMIGHHLLSAPKAPFFTVLGAQKAIDRIVVHSSNQVTAISRTLNVPPARLAHVPYGVDFGFWTPGSDSEERLVAAPGREHRDFTTLAAALRTEDVTVCVTSMSAHSPRASRRAPASWPSNFRVQALSLLELRALYGRAAVVVVPLTAANFPAGVTTILEAMSMGKAVVASDTVGLRGIVEDGETGVLVPVGDRRRLRAAVCNLLAAPDVRRRLGESARRAVVERYGVDRYADTLAQLLCEAAERAARPASRRR